MHSVPANEDVPGVSSTGLFSDMLWSLTGIGSLCIKAKTTDVSLNLSSSQRDHYCWSPHKSNFQINVPRNFLVSYWTWKPGNWIIPSSCQTVCLLKIPYPRSTKQHLSQLHPWIWPPVWLVNSCWSRINDLLPCGNLALISGHKRGNDSIV